MYTSPLYPALLFDWLITLTLTVFGNMILEKSAGSKSGVKVYLDFDNAGGPVDEAQALLDDHIVKSQAMTASPFAKPFEERLIPWERRLVRFQDIIDQWLKCQVHKP